MKFLSKGHSYNYDGLTDFKFVKSLIFLYMKSSLTYLICMLILRNAKLTKKLIAIFKLTQDLK